MSEHGPNDEGFDALLRSIAGELGRMIGRSVESVDVDQLAESTGVDPTAAREWFERAGDWLRSSSETLGDELARRMTRPGPDAAPAADPLGGAGPHPLDLPTEEQGRALAALDSGRWGIEPGTGTLAAKGEGPAPSGALGVVRELRVRDWIALDGELTLAGRFALTRWLDAATSG